MFKSDGYERCPERLNFLNNSKILLMLQAYQENPPFYFNAKYY